MPPGLSMTARSPAGSAASGTSRGRLTAVLVISAVVLVVQVGAAVVSGSLALAADAGHLLADVAAVALALTAVVISERRPPARSTFGLYRLEIFAAAVNAVVLLGVAGAVAWSALRRLDDPPAVDAAVMLVAALLGAAANGVCVRLLHTGAQSDLNVRGAYLEVLSDLLGSLAVLVAAVLIAATGAAVIDPIVSLLVAALIVPRTWLLLREAVGVLLEASPPGTDLEHVRSHIREVAGVVDVHDLHVWTISSGRPVMSAHVVVDEDGLRRPGEVLDALQACLDAHFDVAHCTFQLEPAGHGRHEAGFHP